MSRRWRWICVLAFLVTIEDRSLYASSRGVVSSFLSANVGGFDRFLVNEDGRHQAGGWCVAVRRGGKCLNCTVS